MRISPDDQVTRIAAVAARTPRLVRCEGTESEKREYLAGSTERGWSLARKAARGDFLISVTKGRNPEIVSVTEVHDIASDGAAVWKPQTDIPIVPPVRLKTVNDRVRQPGDRALQIQDTWQTLEGTRAVAFLSALKEVIAEARLERFTEGERLLKECRRRSAALREASLRHSDGLCQACDVDLSDSFGPDAYLVLHVHHINPMSTRPEGRTTTSIDETLVLCPTCHVLLHHPGAPEDLDGLRRAWAKAGTNTR